ncbi:hypothetical protein K461DRAFT_311188 [Myriangium duriaei CBS 260.36]|uniref:NADH dehydrogenase [ubiquinone] 1 beta subcomplex subunit 11, mitochondrial n=1 Tax=Myriangium duriaei CBS 260.36 TaxID=1168546 RepID=A0A9P4J9A2_9PEZI|nr:hypothetical protein K461DRAFT_311188 [Myriangium duriaei CBS 260.36]
MKDLHDLRKTESMALIGEARQRPMTHNATDGRTQPRSWHPEPLPNRHRKPPPPSSRDHYPLAAPPATPHTVMTPLRYSLASRATALRALPKPQIHRAIRPLSTSQSLRSASSHEDHYDPPGGWLWGQRPDEKYEKEGWEGLWTYGFFGAMAFMVVGYCYKPDTSIQTWALEEARRRLEAEGILADPDTRRE